MRIPKEIELHMTEVQELCNRHHVRSLYLFGSAARGEMKPTSDYDFLVDIPLVQENFEAYADSYFEMADSLERMLNRKVDLITLPMLSNPYLIRSIEQSKVKIYGA
jgi:predicted nucleotidyltransferase